MSQPQNCCLWHIETSGAICSPQADLQDTNCTLSVHDGEAIALYFLLEWSVSAMSSLQAIIDFQIWFNWTTQVKMIHSEAIFVRVT